MSGRVAKRLRVTLAALPSESRSRVTLSRFKRGWRTLTAAARGAIAALPDSQERARRLLEAAPPTFPGQIWARSRKRGGAGLLKPFPRVGGTKKNPLRHKADRRRRTPGRP